MHDGTIWASATVGVSLSASCRCLYSSFYFFSPPPPAVAVIAADPSASDNVVPVFGMDGPIISARAERRAPRRIRSTHIIVDNKNVKQMVLRIGPLPFAVKIE